MQIVYYPDPVLVRPAGEIDPGSEGLHDLVEGMLQAMETAEGVGLAAPQVGRSLRVFVASESGEARHAVVCVNPRLKTSGKVTELEEGCLSVPGVRAVIRRPERAVVTALDLEGNEFTLEAEGLMARILQHEYDHIEGVLFLDRMSPADRLRVRGDLKALAEQFHRT